MKAWFHLAALGILIFLSGESFASKLNVFGPDDRQEIKDQSRAPYQQIVKIVAAGGEACSGAIVGSHWVLTAAHCVLSAIPNPVDWQSGALVANLPRYSIAVLVNYHSGNERAIFQAKKVYLGLSHLDHYHEDYIKDLAIIELGPDIGSRYGVLDFDTSAEAPLLNARDLSFSAYDLSRTLLDMRGNPYQVLNQSAQSGCSVRAVMPNGVLYHDCDLERGASGAPLLRCDPNGKCTIIGVNVAEQRNGGAYSLHLKEYSDQYTNYALSLHSIEGVLKQILFQSRFH